MLELQAWGVSLQRMHASIKVHEMREQTKEGERVLCVCMPIGQPERKLYSYEIAKRLPAQTIIIMVPKMKK